MQAIWKPGPDGTVCLTQALGGASYNHRGQKMILPDEQVATTEAVVKQAVKNYADALYANKEDPVN